MEMEKNFHQINFPQHRTKVSMDRVTMGLIRDKGLDQGICGAHKMNGRELVDDQFFRNLEFSIHLIFHKNKRPRRQNGP